MAATRTDTVTVADGSFDLPVWLPASGSGPGLVLFQEIFGVGPYIRAVGDRLAGLGYVVGAPDLFWRIERNWESPHDEAGLQASMGMIQKFDFATGVADAVAAFDTLRSLPEVKGGTGVIGFCLGGTFAWLTAAATQPDVAISYYGSGVAGALDQADAVTCPVIFHFGDSDPYLPNDQVDAIRARVGERETVEIHVQPAGHAFDNHESAMFWNEAAAAAAWERTVDFLDRYLPVEKAG
ncbi:MAG TPA: dienelactone hydrolase family protein [Acidimicrobiales bacterium]|jgi:carboxymethylenebutenolidase